MIFGRKTQVRIVTDRLELRLPKSGDFADWSGLRRESAGFLQPWEPTWSKDHLTRKSFGHRVWAAQRAADGGTGFALFIYRRDDRCLLGAITLDHIHRGPAQSGTLGYWIGERHARQGHMREAVEAVVHHAFTKLDLSRVEAGCLPENVASRGVLEKSGFKYEGVAQSYLQIDGRWRTHVLYAALRSDRRGKTDAG